MPSFSGMARAIGASLVPSLIKETASRIGRIDVDRPTLPYLREPALCNALERLLSFFGIWKRTVSNR